MPLVVVFKLTEPLVEAGEVLFCKTNTNETPEIVDDGLTSTEGKAVIRNKVSFTTRTVIASVWNYCKTFVP